jgi:hypothetical protein
MTLWSGLEWAALVSAGLWTVNLYVAAGKRQRFREKCRSCQVQSWTIDIPAGDTGAYRIPGTSQAYVDFRLMRLLMKVEGHQLMPGRTEEERKAYPEAFGYESVAKPWMESWPVRRLDGPRWEVQDTWDGEWLAAPFLSPEMVESAYQVFTNSFRPFTSEELALLEDYPWFLWPWQDIKHEGRKHKIVPLPDGPPAGVREVLERRRGKRR